MAACTGQFAAFARIGICAKRTAGTRNSATTRIVYRQPGFFFAAGRNRLCRLQAQPPGKVRPQKTSEFQEKIKAEARGNTVDSVFTNGTAQLLEIGFVPFRNREKYSHAAINGFVDSKRII